jgi:ketosteroid isomerase-like protein
MSVRIGAMGEAEVKLFQSWAEQLAVVEDQLGFLYEHTWAADIDHRALQGAPDDVGPIIGREAMRAYLADWFETFEGFRVVPEEILDAGPERVIVTWHVSGTARASGVPTELRVAITYTIRDGRIVRGREYQTAEEARAALAREG